MIDDLLSMEDLSAEHITRILDTAEEFKDLAVRPIKKVPVLRGRTVCNLFYEDSTRTRISFEVAEKRLSADVINFSAKGSSVSKGESLKDTALTLQAMGVDAIVIRHSAAGAPRRLTEWVDAKVLNAGDGRHQHPTQGLLDLYTIRERLGHLEGLRVAICGDVVHSRVARSLVQGLATMGCDVTLVSPPTLLPAGVESWPVTVTHDLDSILDGLDVCYLLRVQTERMKEQFFPSAREYARIWGMDIDRLARMPEHGIIMHPGPMNRGVEISADVADADQAVIVEQVTNGVAVRMSCLYLMLGGEQQQRQPPENPAWLGGWRLGRCCRGTAAMTDKRTFTLAGCQIIDPTAQTVRLGNVVVEGQTIRSVGEESAGLRIECEGLVCAPGLVDLSTHLREPGREDAETIETGTRAGAAGGYTAVCALPTTDPVMDHAGVVEQVLRLAREAGHCEVVPVGAITRNLEGAELAEMGAMHAAGVRAFYDAGHPIRSAQVLRRAMVYAKTWDAIVINHAEDPTLTVGAQMNEGHVSSRLGLQGAPREAEEIMIARDLLLAERVGARIHVPHVTTRRGVALIAEAKSRGVRVTADVTPHHVVLDETVVEEYQTQFKVRPPLRTADDVQALRDALQDGTIDAIATDHAPHPTDDKDTEWDTAPAGTTGLETASGGLRAGADRP